MKTKDGLDLRKFFERTYKAFKEKGVILYRAGRADDSSGEFFQPLYSSDTNYWSFRVTLSPVGLVWRLSPGRNDKLIGLILDKVAKKFHLYGYINEKGFYRSGSNVPEKLTDINIVEIFFGAIKFYEKLLKDTEEERNRLLKEMEDKFNEFLATLN